MSTTRAASGGDREVGAVHGPRIGLIVEQLRRPVPGGIGTYIRGLLSGIVAIVDPPSVELYASRPSENPDPLAIWQLPLRTSKLSSRVLAVAWERGLGRIGEGLDVVHACSFALAPTTRPLVVTVHDLAWRAVPSAYPARGRRWHEAALARALARASAFVVPAESVRSALLDAAPELPPSRVHIVAEGADHLPPADDVATTTLLGDLGVLGGFLLAVGTLEPRKNLAGLVRAYGIARPSFPEPWPLVICGPSGWGKAFGDLPPGVVVTGSVPAGVLAGLYARARLLAYVPLLEGFGLPVVEAMSAGLPVVSSAVPSAGEGTYLVDPNDSESIAEGLRVVASDDARRAQLVADGRRHVEPLTWAACAAGHLEVWRAVRQAEAS